MNITNEYPISIRAGFINILGNLLKVWGYNNNKQKMNNNDINWKIGIPTKPIFENPWFKITKEKSKTIEDISKKSFNLAFLFFYLKLQIIKQK